MEVNYIHIWFVIRSIEFNLTSQNPKIANNTNMLNFEGSLQLLKIGLYTQGQDRWKLHAKTIHSLMGKSGSYKAAAKSGTSGPKTYICIHKFQFLYDFKPIRSSLKLKKGSSSMTLSPWI